MELESINNSYKDVISKVDNNLLYTKTLDHIANYLNNIENDGTANKDTITEFKSEEKNESTLKKNKDVDTVVDTTKLVKDTLKLSEEPKPVEKIQYPTIPNNQGGSLKSDDFIFTTVRETKTEDFGF